MAVMMKWPQMLHHQITRHSDSVECELQYLQDNIGVNGNDPCDKMVQNASSSIKHYTQFC